MDQILTGWVPAWVMVAVVAVLTICLIIGVPLARAAGARRHRRNAHPEDFTRRERIKDTALFLAAMIPSLLVWLAVMGVSFIGLTGFAADIMQWTHWTNMLVPLSLDGISISFGAWAFVAVKRKRHPGRAYKIVLAAATVSATLNFVHGRDEWSLWAGIYLAFLSMVGMAMFHELLDQFMGEAEEILLKTKNPRFGLRWILAPWSTFLAWRTWIVYPPVTGTLPSVRNALDHREAWVENKRTTKLAHRSTRVVEEQQARIVEALAKADAERARTQPETFRPHAAPVNGYAAAANGHPANGAAIQAVTLTPLDHANGIRREPTPSVAPAPRCDTMVDSGELNMTQRSLSAAMDQPAREMIAAALRGGERINSTVVCDWVAEQVATLNQEWRPSEGWAKQRIRDVKQQLGYPAQDELAEAAR